MTKAKNISIILMTVLGLSFFSACSNKDDVKAAKNTSPIKGYWVEETDPECVVKITADGEIFYYTLKSLDVEVEKNGESRGNLVKNKNANTYHLTTRDEVDDTETVYTFDFLKNGKLLVVVKTYYKEKVTKEAEFLLIKKSHKEVKPLIDKALDLKENEFKMDCFSCI